MLLKYLAFTYLYLNHRSECLYGVLLMIGKAIGNFGHLDQCGNKKKENTEKNVQIKKNEREEKLCKK